NYYNYSTDKDFDESFSIDQDEPLFVHDYLAAMKTKHWLEEQDSSEIIEYDDNNDTNQVLKLFSRWLSNLSYSENENQKKETATCKNRYED
ncbi:36124_t:CDS:2, partial [Racocetra persica]